MKYIKTYENSINEPQVDDYVICEEPNNKKEIKEFLENNIGQITYYDGYQYTVKYYNIPFNLKNAFRNNIRIMARDEIEYFSKYKEELISHLELKYDAAKYNI